MRVVVARPNGDLHCCRVVNQEGGRRFAVAARVTEYVIGRESFERLVREARMLISEPACNDDVAENEYIAEGGHQARVKMIAAGSTYVIVR